MPIVSIILPCFNSEKLIREAVDSIVKQSVRDWELIIVDDASVDRSFDVISGLIDPRILLVKHSENRGYPTAMNTGLAIATGKYIARMDADDVCEPTRLEEQLNALELYPQASFCGVSRYRITPGGKLYIDRRQPKEKYLEETWDDLMSNARRFTDPSVLIEKSKLLEVGGYRTFQRSGMDVDLWLRVMEKFGPCITITKPLFGKRLEPGSLIFKPQTALINQVPRALARQRKLDGQDVVEKGEKIDLVSMLKKGLIRPTSHLERMALFIGSAVTCLMLLDAKGFRIYYNHAWNVSESSVERLKMNFQLLYKLIMRFRHNPYRQFIPL